MRCKDYEAIASVIGSISCDGTRSMIATDLCNYFIKENPRFNVDRFLKAVDYYRDQHGNLIKG